MEAVSGGNGGLWGWKWEHQRRRIKQSKASKSSDSATGGGGYRFPLKQAVTAGALALTGDTVAQVTDRWKKNKPSKRHSFDQDASQNSNDNQDFIGTFLSGHDWLRALRMTSYGFLLYGPGSYAWYQCLDHCLPKQTVKNLMLKVLLNQVVLGPSVIAVIFAWNNLWQGKLSQLPEKYQRDALPTLLYGFRFWIPVSILNFWHIFCPFLGCPHSSSCSFHVHGVYILELLLVINNEQVDCYAPWNHQCHNNIMSAF